MFASLEKHYFHYFQKWGIPFLRWKNQQLGRKKILIYTDSRGINIPNHYYYKHYPVKLAYQYAVSTYLVPHRSTTIPDFLWEYERNKSWQNDFDHIILHAGIVGFSPRPISQILDRIYPEKKELYQHYFGKENIENHYSKNTGVPYYGEPTQNLYSLKMATEVMLPKLQKIPNLLFIGGHKIVPNWRGNYWRDRPENLNMVEEFFQIFEDELPNSIDLLHWSQEDVKENTYDGIHYNEKGSDIILKNIEEHIVRRG